MEKLIDDYLKEEISWNSFLNPYLFASCDDSKDIAELIQFLTEKTNFIYHDICSDMPFQSFLVFPDQKSINVNNLSIEDIPVIQKVIFHSKNPYLIGKMYDIIGCIRKDREAFLKCADCYYSIFSKSITTEHIQVHPLHRALYLYKKYDNSKMKTIYNELLKADYPTLDQKLTIIYYLVEFKEKTKLKLDKSDIQIIIEILKTHSRTDDCGLYLAKRALASGLCTDTEKSFLRNKYADICEFYCSLSPYNFHELERALDILDDEEDEQRINEILYKIDDLKESVYNHMSEHTVPIPDQISKEIHEKYTEFESFLKRSTSINKLLLLINKMTIDYSIDFSEEEHALSSIFSHTVFNDEKEIIYDSKTASPFEKKSYTISRNICLQLSYKYFYISLFYKYFSVDSFFDELLTEIMSHNFLIPSNRKDVIYENIIYGLSNINNIRKSLYNLISQFEFGCVQFLRNHKRVHPKTTKGKRKESINLNDILVEKDGTAKYREPIVELLGADITRSLEYLLCKKNCGNFRNKDYHEGVDPQKDISILEVSAFIFIVNAYCMGYDESL